MSPVGAVILAVFGAIWCAVALAAMTGAIDLLTFVPVLVAVAISVIALKTGRTAPQRSTDQARRVGRIVGLASALEGIAIPIVASVLASMDRYDLIVPAIAAIVGLHFLPIAWAMPYRPYYLLAGLLLALAAGSLLLPPNAVRTMTVGFGSGMLLWIACGLALARMMRQTAHA